MILIFDIVFFFFVFRDHIYTVDIDTSHTEEIYCSKVSSFKTILLNKQGGERQISYYLTDKRDLTNKMNEGNRIRSMETRNRLTATRGEGVDGREKKGKGLINQKVWVTHGHGRGVGGSTRENWNNYDSIIFLKEQICTT